MKMYETVKWKIMARNTKCIYPFTLQSGTSAKDRGSCAFMLDTNKATDA